MYLYRAWVEVFKGAWRVRVHAPPYLSLCVKARNETEKSERLGFGHIYTSAHPIPHCIAHTLKDNMAHNLHADRPPAAKKPLIPNNPLCFLFPEETDKLFSSKYEIFVFLFLRWAWGMLCFHVWICRAPAHNGPSVRFSVSGALRGRKGVHSVLHQTSALNANLEHTADEDCFMLIVCYLLLSNLKLIHMLTSFTAGI